MSKNKTHMEQVKEAKLEVSESKYSTMTNVDIRNIFIEKYKNKDFTDDGMLELIGSSFTITDEVIFKELDIDYARIEHDWYLSQSLNVNDMVFTPKIWKQVADIDGNINSNYGWMVFSEENGFQYRHCLHELHRNTNSRRASCIYQRPSMHSDALKNSMNEFTCTWGVDYHIRDNKLLATVKMRSNDLVFGTPLDYNWQRFVQARLAEDLGIKVGDMIWQASSLHLYPRHFHLVEKWL